MPRQDEGEKILHDYLNKNHILILDAISTGRTNIASCLAKFGATRSKMSLLGTMAEAREEIKRVKPKIIFADFMIGKESSIDLIQDQKKQFEKDGIKDTFFVLVTSNASQSTVARAAEEDVDTFIIKPFSLDTMKKGLMRSVKDKLFPSEYHKVIDVGKDLMFKGDFKGALDCFKRATDLSDTPTLAHFYAGQAEYMQKALSMAEGSYEEGLSYNNIHYKCLTGLFDLLHNEKRYDDAYDVMRRLAQYFPANPKRLASVLQLSVQTGHFDDVDSYYKIFVELEERTDEMIRYMCSTLAVTGKYYLKQHSNQRALQAFESAAISSAGRIKYLYYMIETLVEYGLVDNTDKFISRLKNSDPGSKELIAAQFLTIDKSASPVDVVNRGRSVLRDGVEFPSVYEKLIKNSLMAGYKDSALELASQAIKKWPDQSSRFTAGFSAEDLKTIGIL